MVWIWDTVPKGLCKHCQKVAPADPARTRHETSLTDDANFLPTASFPGHSLLYSDEFHEDRDWVHRVFHGTLGVLRCLRES